MVRILPDNQVLSRIQRRSCESKKIEIKRLLKKKGCPICRICDEHLKSVLFWFFNETYAGGSNVDKYIDYWGFCEKHTKMVAKIGPEWQKSAIYSWIIENQLPKIQRIHKAILDYHGRSQIKQSFARRNYEKVVEKVKPRGKCLFCESMTQTSDYYIEELLKALNDAEIQDLYAKSSGLCMQHFFQALDFFNGKNGFQITKIVKSQLRRLSELKHDFEEFFRKGDYRFSHEPKGREQDTWIRAMKKIIGEVDLGE